MRRNDVRRDKQGPCCFTFTLITAVAFTVLSNFWTSAAQAQVTLQGTTPGTQQVGHMNISGTGLFGDKLGVGTLAPGAPLDFTIPFVRTYTAQTQGIAFLGKTNEPSQFAGLGLSWKGGATAADRMWIFQTIENGVANAGNIAFQAYGGKVGIGTTMPAAPLDFTIPFAKTYTTQTQGIAFLGKTNESSQFAGLNLSWIGGATAADRSWIFQTIEDGVANAGNVLFQAYGGRVGIGTTTPTAKLDVVGDAAVSGNMVVGGNIAAKYQDVAEWVPSTRVLAPGMVVVLDLERSNNVVPSSFAYDTGVAGVVSDTPGILLGEGGEGKVKVATTGRVKVKVDATKKPVRVGDLLVTSGKRGMAMRSEPIDVAGAKIHRPGTIIGKALEPLPAGEGEVLVLLSLQ